jgi:hypothetical protein
MSTPKPVRRIASHHIDSCHVPDEDERHAPPSSVPTRSHSPTHDQPHDDERSGSGTEHTLAGENPIIGETGDVEKQLRKRAHGEPAQVKEARQVVPAEKRDWQDDIVT